MKEKIYKNTTAMSFIFWLGYIGSGLYFIPVVPGFRAGLLGILKALTWPVLLAFETFSFYDKKPGKHE